MTNCVGDEAARRRTGYTACMLVLIMTGAAWGQSPTFVSLISHRVTNTGSEPARNVVASCVLPVTNRYQEIIDTRIDPPPTETHDDREGQKIVVVPLGDLAPGETRAVRVLVWARLKTLSVPLRGVTRKPTTLPAEEEMGQLGDGWLLQMNRVRPLAVKNAGDGPRDLDRAAKLFEFMKRECTYDIDEKFDTADRILNGTPASCTELAYTFVSLCRSIGIPARMVSAYVNRDGTSPSTDWRTHRWVEFYTKEYGWVPADPTNAINDNSKVFFGRQEGMYLTVIDDGVRDPAEIDPEWRVFDVRGEAPPTDLELSRSAVWRVSSNRTQEAANFATASGVLRDPDVEKRRAAVASWVRTRDVMMGGYLLEAIFDLDPSTRDAAVAAIGKIGDVSMVIPLILRASKESDPATKASLVAAAGQILATPNAARRAQVVADLCKTRKVEALDLLDQVCDDASRDVRKVAAQLLFKFGNRAKVHAAYRVLVQDSDEFIAALAKLRWARTGSIEPEPLLVEMLTSDVPWDRKQALKELSKRAGQTFGYDMDRKPDGEKNVEALARWRAWSEERQGSASASQPASEPEE